MAERLLHDHPGVLGQPRVVELLDHRAEQERGNLEVEDRLLGAAHGGFHPLVGGRIGEVAADVLQAGGEARKHGIVNGLTGCFDHGASMLAQVLDRPVVCCHADDRTRQETARLQPVEGVQGHHPGQIVR